VPLLQIGEDVDSGQPSPCDHAEYLSHVLLFNEEEGLLEGGSDLQGHFLSLTIAVVFDLIYGCDGYAAKGLRGEPDGTILIPFFLGLHVYLAFEDDAIGEVHAGEVEFALFGGHGEAGLLGGFAGLVVAAVGRS
jgi:hypothetical protein